MRFIIPVVLFLFCSFVSVQSYYNTIYISGDGFRSMADRIFDERSTMANGSSVCYGDIVFVNADILDAFFKKIHPTISCKYVLITHNSDYEVPGSYVNYLDDEKIMCWFGQNPSIVDHEKFVPVPIGIANRKWPHGKEETIVRCLKCKYKAKKYLLGFNFNVFTIPKEREPAMQYCMSLPYAYNLRHISHLKYLQNMRLAQYIISPRGNGLDCHRTWEALIVGAIPIVISSPLDSLLKDLPVLIINDWSEINQRMLEERYTHLRDRFALVSMQKITYGYWYQVIKGYQKQLREHDEHNYCSF